MAHKLHNARVANGRSARIATIAEVILNNSHSILQLVVGHSLLIAALYIIITPNHSGTTTDWAIGILGLMVGRILKFSPAIAPLARKPRR
jgi:uncharacterized membrane protein HdeD (DUF308 family)